MAINVANVFAAVLVCTAVTGVCARTAVGMNQTLPVYDVAIATAPWPKPVANQYLGDVRAVVQPLTAGKTNIVQVFWRRRDNPLSPLKSVIVTTSTGTILTDVQASASQVCGKVTWTDHSDEDTDVYHVYWLPHYQSGGGAHLYFYWNNKTAAIPTTLSSGYCESVDTTVNTRVSHVETRDTFHNWSKMEMIASETEMVAVGQYAQEKSLPFSIFMDHRETPSRMFTGPMLPVLWAQAMAMPFIELKASPGEYLVFQMGVYASQAAITNLTVQLPQFLDMAAADQPSVTCFNTQGTDYNGNAYTKSLQVRDGWMKVLWFGMQLANTTKSFSADFTVVGSLDGKTTSTVAAHIDVAVSGGDPLPFGGLDNIYNLGRLRWLDSTLGIDDSIPFPYVPVGVEPSTASLALTVLNKNITVGQDGLPQSAVIKTTKSRKDVDVVSFSSVLNGTEVRVFRQGSTTPVEWTVTSPTKITSQRQSIVSWEATSTDGANLELTVFGSLEFDSYLTLGFNLTSKVEDAVADVQLVVSFANNKYMLGMQQLNHSWDAGSWKWNLNTGENGLWGGSAESGLYVQLDGPGSDWKSPMFNKDYAYIPSIPTTWGGVNTTLGLGGANWTSDGTFVAFSGPRPLSAQEPTTFLFDMIVTPAHPVNLTKHWGLRSYQIGYGCGYATPQEVKDKGATVAILHQGIPGVINGTLMNPYINYPFVPDTVVLMENFTQQSHDLGMTNRFYYTIRELSNHAAELFALLSLDGEIVTDLDPYIIPQPGYCQSWDCHGGAVWLQEHVLKNYSACWQQGLSNGEWDAAVCDKGESRWLNYYIEGLKWSLEQPPHMTGIYYDGINYARTSMQRIRRVLATVPSATIDLHTGHSNARRPSVGYLSHYAYTDSVWNGEGFNFNADPLYWLTEISGAPQGLSGDRLGGGPAYDHRGMLFSMTQRNSPTASSLWEFWDYTSIENTTRIGWWEGDAPAKVEPQSSACTTDPALPNALLTTTYVKYGEYFVVAIGSWCGAATESVKLTFDWDLLGLNEAEVNVQVPAIAGVQEAANMTSPDSIFTLTKNSGRLLHITKK